MSVLSSDPGAGLLGRRGERAALHRLLDRTRAGRSAVLVVGMLFEGWPAASLPAAQGRALTLALTTVVATALNRASPPTPMACAGQ
jgi:hypothetical protein